MQKKIPFRHGMESFSSYNILCVVDHYDCFTEQPAWNNYNDRNELLRADNFFKRKICFDINFKYTDTCNF